MRTGCGVGDAVSTLRYGVAVVTIGYEGVSVSGRRVGGVSTGGGDGGRVSTEGSRVDVGSVGVAIDVAKISEMLWIACNCSSLRV